MSAHVATLYGVMSLSVLACGPNDRPTSMTSGAWGPGLVVFALMASTSWAELPSGFSSLILMPYLAVKPVSISP